MEYGLLVEQREAEWVRGERNAVKSGREAEIVLSIIPNIQCIIIIIFLPWVFLHEQAEVVNGQKRGGLPLL